MPTNPIGPVGRIQPILSEPLRDFKEPFLLDNILPSFGDGDGDGSSTMATNGDSDESKFRLRSYQEEMLEASLGGNVIVKVTFIITCDFMRRYTDLV